jgi:hypothetical protein
MNEISLDCGFTRRIRTSGNIRYLAIVHPDTKVKRKKLRTKIANPSHCSGAEPEPYGKLVSNADVIPVPIITACQAQVKCLYCRSAP